MHKTTFQINQNLILEIFQHNTIIITPATIHISHNFAPDTTLRKRKYCNINTF